MFRVRTVLILVAVTTVVYWLLPDRRKTRIKGRFREIVTAVTVAVIVYWIYMISMYVWEHWPDP